MHAPAVLQHYKVARSGNIGRRYEMIDVERYVANNLEGTSPKDSLAHEGGSSIQFLDIITNRASTESFKFPKKAANLRKLVAPVIAESLREYGPALVSQFHVDKNFAESGKQSFLDDEVGEKLGMHAMVMIGYRQRGDEYVFLLQNWWEGRYFIEVSESYLAQADANIVFITEDLTEIPANLPTINEPYMETDADCPERYPFEKYT